MSPALLWLGLSLAQAAEAPVFYVNGVRADGLRDFNFESVDVRVDEAGNIWVDAPRYKVEVEEDGTSKASDLKPKVAAGGEEGAPEDGQAARVPEGRYWLVSEDHGSTGLVVDVVVNGTLVRKVRSGDPQLILDIGAWLQLGDNAVVVNLSPGRKSPSGTLSVYLGTGDNQSGTVVLDRPQISYTSRAGDVAAKDSQSYTLPVQ